MKSKGVKVVLVFLLIGVLAIIRAKGELLFYDPLIQFFKSDYLNSSLPELNYFKLFSSLFSRYILNSIISLAIIYVIFLKKDYVIFSFYVFSIGFVIFAIPYYFLIKNYINEQYLVLFYIRRILIQPVLVLLLIPAFYYFKNSDN